jgi:hypothetical protein
VCDVGVCSGMTKEEAEATILKDRPSIDIVFQPEVRAPWPSCLLLDIDAEGIPMTSPKTRHSPWTWSGDPHGVRVCDIDRARRA